MVISVNQNNKCGKLYIVVPCYNEEEALEPSAIKLLGKLTELVDKGLVSKESRIVFVDDGSKDKTWSIIKKFYEENEAITGLRLAHNRGHQNALLAGLMYARKYCDFAISIDADLQQDINAIELFIEEYYAGNEVVYGVRNSRNTDTFFKRVTASAFYKLMGWLGGNIYANSADYRLMSAKALDALAEYDEVNLFLRGIIPDIGFQTSVVHFDVFPRQQGESKYSLSKMMTLALDGITSFSIKPIRLVFMLGIMALVVGFIMIIHVFYEYFFGTTVSGWSEIMCSIWLLGGAILLSLGIIGEYVGRNYLETKRRPRYYLWDVLSRENDEKK